MQLTIDALRLTPTLRAMVCNIEMPPAVLLDRQLARLSGIDLTTIRYRKLGAKHADRIDQAMNTLEPLVERLGFVRPSFDLANVAGSVDDFEAGLILLDYIQRIRPPGEHENRRGTVDATMDYMRRFAEAGMAIIVVSAVGRSKDRHGRNYYNSEGLNLASFRESSELEFGADDAFILAADSHKDDGAVRLKHLKARHGELHDATLAFNPALQRFAAEYDSDGAAGRGGKLTSTLERLWENTEPAADEETGRGP